MLTETLLSDEILDPISPDRPAGADLRWTAEWDRIKEARRADDSLDAGKWVKKERKVADWRTVQELTSAALRRSKDLQLALWLTEANLRLHGFPGLYAGLRVVRELMVRYWDQGLYPSMEDGPDDRAGPFEWLNNKLVDAFTTLPITARRDSGQDYSFNDLVDARRVGTEAACRRADGEADEAKRKAYDAAVAGGRISLDLFEAAVRATPRAAYEEFSSYFDRTFQEFKQLERVVDEKFGEGAPALSGCRTVLEQIRVEVDKILEKRRSAEPDVPIEPDSPESEEAPGMTNPVTVRFPLSLPELSGSTGGIGSSWEDAEILVRTGQVDKGLARMIQLSARETTGRNRFQRRLLLAEACLASRRTPLARSILEELAEQIDKLQLDAWESSETVSSVWTRLYRLYRQSGAAEDEEKAQKLYQRLCRLDPWQALGCGEA